MNEDMREQGDQIREALSALKALQVDEDAYLKLEDVYEVTGDTLYPNGLTTEDEYERLVVISKAGCKAIGYSSEEVTLLPPLVSFEQRGTYLKKMPIINDKVMAKLIDELVTEDYEFMDIPLTAIARSKLAPKLAHKHYKRAWTSFTSSEQEYLIQRGDYVAKELGYEMRTFNDPPWLAGQMLYTKAMTPSFTAWKEAVGKVVSSRAYPKVNIVIAAGLRAAFNDRTDRDPENIISLKVWRDLFDELGYIYDPEQNRLTPKPLNFSSNTITAIVQGILGLPTYNHPKIGDFLIKDDLYQAAREVMCETITKGRLKRLMAEGVIGRILIKLGYQLTTRWLSRYELTMLPKQVSQGVEVFTRAMSVSSKMETPALAKGFRIHSPVLIRDETTLVYMELLGPRQAVKANWAALRQRHKNNYLKGRLEVEKEDELTTLKTALPCGWDHWCLIHRQASYSKLTPQETFYLTCHNTKPAETPNTFTPFLAKSLAIPILPEWAQYLWVEGRMKGLISPLSKDCYGYGGWKVEVHKWGEIVSEGLNKKEISF